MQEKDLVSIEYFENPERFADLLNGYLFDGKPVVKPENVRERNRVVTRTAREERQIENGYVIRDVVQDVGIERAAFDAERIRQEFGEEKAGEGKSRSGFGEELVGGEKLYTGFGMQVTIVALEEQAKIHYAMPVRVMNSDATTYHRQWRKKRKSHWKKKDLRGAEYVEANKQIFSELEEDAYDMISCMSKSGELKVIKKKCQKEKGGKVNMCQAITEMIEDGRREGELMFAQLTKVLLKDGEVEALSRAADDEKYRRKLYRKYDIKSE